METRCFALSFSLPLVLVACTGETPLTSTASTAQRILDLLPSGTIKENTRLVLTNAVYFLALWQKPFSESATQPEPFQPLVGPAVVVPTMHKEDGHCAYAAGDGYVLAELPYIREQVAMTLLVPDTGRFSEIEAGLTGEKLESMFAALAPAELEIALPRFHIELALDLQETLRALGMADAFGLGADFSGIDGAKDLSVQAVVHKAFIDIDEEGTEAAAATAVPIYTSGASVHAQVVVDRPFLFFLRDRVTGAILFVGRVTNPAAA